MGIKERRTKILLSLFLFSGVKFTPITLDDKLQKIFDFSLNQKTRGTISGLIKEGLIEKSPQSQTDLVGTIPPSLTKVSESKSPSSDTSAVYPSSAIRQDTNQYRLTEKGFYGLCLQFPFFRYLKDKWDARWRIISYEIPEKKRELRDRLRREMQGWGLGPWHRSFWLTPHPIIDTLKNLISQKEEEEYIQAFESDHVFGKREILIEKVWQKTLLDKKYRELFKVWHDVLAGTGEKTDKFKTVIYKYIDILRIDPGLPVELVGEKWIGFEAWNIFGEIKGILLS